MPDALAARATGELKAKVRQEREAVRDRLVADYARERDALLAAELPAVRRRRRAGQRGASLPALAGSENERQGAFGAAGARARQAAPALVAHDPAAS